MKILALDTSTSHLAFTIFDKHKTIIEKNSNLSARHGESLSSVVSKSLTRAGLSIDDIDGFIVGVGPGSFTGLRVGMALIKGFCFVKKSPFLMVPSTDLIAANLINEEKDVCVVLDARKQKVYASFYKSKHSFKKASKPALLDPDDFISRLRKTFKNEVLFTGDGIEPYADIIKKNIKRASFADEGLWYPKSGSLKLIGLERFHNHFQKDTSKLKPLYLHKKECQIHR